MAKKKALVLVVLVIFSTIAYCQNVIISQSIINPYIFNPAYAGYEGQSTVTLTHRRQWMGINDAPVTSNLVFHLPFLSGVNFGANITQDQGGIFNSSSGLLTAGYTLNLGWNHFMRFGLSMGGGNTNLDLSEGVNFNDPALANVLESTSYLDGNFGMAYHFHGFNVGFTLSNLFNREVYGTESFTPIEFDALQNFIINADLILYLADGQYAFHPYILYKSFQSQPSQIEAGAVFHINHILWIGGAYRQNFGYSSLLGFKIQETMAFGYAYDFSSNNISGVNQSTHELQLTFFFGLQSERSRRYSTFLRSEEPDPEIKATPPPKEVNPRFKRGQKY